MKVAISGASGLIGSALVKYLLDEGHIVVKLVRPGGPIGLGSISWDPERGHLEVAALEGLDAVVHLAGENIASRWTEEKKNRIRNSRISGTRLLCSRLRSLKNPPTVAVLASAVGIYGDRGDEELTEESPPGRGFLAEVTQEWESASKVLDESNIRAVRLRTGMVLSKDGGALARLITPFKMGIGGKMGSGHQYISWIAIDDIIRIIEFAIINADLSGPVNAVSPYPVTNAEFSRTLGRVLGRPAIATVPTFALKLWGGEMAREILLASTRVLPGKLLLCGYKYIHPTLEEALKKQLQE